MRRSRSYSRVRRDRQARAVGGEAQQADRLGVEVAPRQRADLDRADDPAAVEQRHRQQRGDRAAERARVDAGGGNVGDRDRAALAGDALDDAVDDGLAGLALDDRVHAAGGARGDRARLVGQHGGGAIDVERVEDAVQQLAQELLEAHGAEHRGGDRLHDLQALGGGLGLGARRLRADELLAVALRAAALAQVLQLQDEVRPAAVACGRASDALTSTGIVVPRGPVEPALELVVADRARHELLARARVDADVGARAELVERVAEQLGGAAAERLLQRAVDVADAPVGVGARHPDRRVLERRAQLLLALGERAPALVELAEDLDLRAQDERVDRLEEVVDGARRRSRGRRARRSC